MCAEMRKRTRSVSGSVTEMGPKLWLCVFMTLIEVSLAVWQRVTAMKGQTVDLFCPVTNAHQTIVEWKNPEGHIMFFSHTGQVSRGVVSERYSVKKPSETEFVVSIADVTFGDAGNYTCYEYGHRVTERKVELTVLGLPKITQRRSKGRIDLKCTAQANYRPPQIIWKLDDGPEMIAQSQVIREDKSYLSLAILSIQAVEDKVTVTCLVKHPALYTQPLVDFVNIRPKTKTFPWCITSPPRPPHQSSTQQRTPAERRPSERSTSAPPPLFTQPRTHTVSTEAPRHSLASISPDVRHNSTASEGTLTSSDDAVHHATSTEGGPNLQKGPKESSAVLVFLVTCLIFALLVVVIFFVIKLRRAHIAWKKENEDSDPSEESSKSKSSQEEKKSQGQKPRGLLKTMFTQYVVEEPAVVTSVINTAALNIADNANKEQTLQPEPKTQTGVKFSPKETDL